MENNHTPFLMAEQQIQEIADELNRLRDVTRLLTGAQTGIDQVLQSCQQLNDRVADLTHHLRTAVMSFEENSLTELNASISEVKQGIESMRRSQDESRLHFDAQLSTHVTELNASISEVKQGVESIQGSQHENKLHLDTLLSTLAYLKLATEQMVKNYNEQLLQLGNTSQLLNTQIEHVIQKATRDHQSMNDRLTAIEVRQKHLFWLLTLVAVIILAVLMVYFTA